jgi:hypothetical protein
VEERGIKNQWSDGGVLLLCLVVLIWKVPQSSCPCHQPRPRMMMNTGRHRNSWLPIMLAYAMNPERPRFFLFWGVGE